MSSVRDKWNDLPGRIQAVAAVLAVLVAAAALYVTLIKDYRDCGPSGNCGFWKDEKSALYTHSGNNCIVIKIDYVVKKKSTTRRVFQKGTEDLGHRDEIKFAKFDRVCKPSESVTQ
ncbi:DUF6355 family natural product biosynthesis protein [Streptosporangium soli]|nr:DUF6355 family natural product biosynthesis protein [Streptosporangium sp. KLBMP 9127]